MGAYLTVGVVEWAPPAGSQAGVAEGRGGGGQGWRPGSPAADARASQTPVRPASAHTWSFVVGLVGTQVVKPTPESLCFQHGPGRCCCCCQSEDQTLT